MTAMLLALALSAHAFVLTNGPAVAPLPHRMATPVTMSEPIGIRRFLSDLEFLGPCRFVVQGSGAILEALGAFDDLRVSDTPKGSLATLSSDDSFECHIKMDEVKAATFVTKDGADGKELYMVRLLDGNDTSILSAILHRGGEGYEEGAVDFWKQLKDRFGEKVDLTAEETFEEEEL